MIRSDRHNEPRFAHLAEIVIDRPEKRNALTADMLDAIAAMAAEFASDASIRAIVLRGEGSTFCSGFDLSRCLEDPGALPAMLRALSLTIRALRRVEKPVVIAVHGAAVAGGCALLGGADLVVSHPDAKLGYPVLRLGISPAVNAPTLVNAVGLRATRERMLDPVLISGAEAQRIGLVDRLVDLAEDVVPRAQIEAVKLGDKPPQALAATKRWLNELDGSTADEPFERALATSLAIAGNAEERALLAAYLAR